MAKQIRTYVLAPPFIVETHRGAVPIAARFFNGGLYVDMEVDTANLVQNKNFTILGIGASIPDHVEKFIGAVEVHEADGFYRLYVYEDKENVGILL